MARLPSRFRRLDEILADLPVADPMPLTELDGYLTGVVVCPEAMPPPLWLPPIWGGGHGEAPPFEDPIDVRLFADMVMARHDEIERDLARGRLQPIFDVGRDGDVLWEEWVGGFERATGLIPECWAAGADEAGASAETPAARMRALADVAFDRSSLTAGEINAICDAAPALIATLATALHADRGRPATVSRPPAVAKVGRNDPCPCGSGRKRKRCCGTAR